MDKKKVIGIICFFFLTTLYLFKNTSRANAQGISLSISPPLIKITATAPADIRATVTVRNTGSEPISAEIVLKPFSASDTENGQVSYPSDQQKFQGEILQLFQNIHILEEDTPVTSITIAPSQEKTLTLAIDLKENQTISEYYFSLLFIASPVGSIGSIGVKNDITGSTTPLGIGTNIILSIGPQGKPKGELVEFSAPHILEKRPVPFTIRVRNTGDRLLVASGTILITNMFGQTIGKVDLLPVNILKHTTRAIPDAKQIPSKQQLPQDTYHHLPTAYWSESFLLGPYTATLTLSLSSQGPAIKRSIQFVALPLELLGFFALALLLTLIVVVRVRKRLREGV